MATCGEKYFYLVRTATGRTREDPCPLGPGTVWCDETHYDEWYQAAVDLVPKIATHWAALRKAELKAGEGTPASDALRATLKGYSEATQKLWDPWFAAVIVTPAQKIEQTISVMEMGCCELEKIDEKMQEIGMTPPPVVGPKGPVGGTTGSAIKETAQTVGMVLIVGLVGYGVWKYAMRKPLPAIGEPT